LTLPNETLNSGTINTKLARSHPYASSERPPWDFAESFRETAARSFRSESLACEKKRFKEQATTLQGMQRSTTVRHAVGEPHHGN
jgi:hypothetical protein